MTEGPEAHALADRIREALDGRRVDHVEFLQRDGTPVATRRLIGRRIVGVESHGKNLLVHVEGGDTFRIHLLMRGRVRIGSPDEALDGRLRLALHAEGVRVAVVGAPKIELVATADLETRRHAWGPDATRPDFDASRFMENLAAQGERTVAEVLLDQSVVAGIGNLWKCEILHEARIDPRTACSGLSPAQRGRLVQLVPKMMREAYEARRERRKIPARVYHRSGHPCRACGARILYFRLGGRATYACPVCQAGPRETRRA